MVKWLLPTVMAVFALWLFWLFQSSIFQWWGISWNISSAGSLGDTFGALNALFAAFAFLGVLATLSVQRKQLADQEKELKGQMVRLELQEKAQHISQFERNFFQLLRLHRDLRGEITVRISGKPNTARIAIDTLVSWLRMGLAERRFDSLSRASIADYYIREVHAYGEDGLGAYFRVIYTILRRISEDTVLTIDEKAKYGNLLRSQFTSSELVLVGFNGLAPFSQNFSEYLIEFRMLKYLPEGPFLTTLKRHYPTKAFAARD